MDELYPQTLFVELQEWTHVIQNVIHSEYKEHPNKLKLKIYLFPFVPEVKHKVILFNLMPIDANVILN